MSKWPHLTLTNRHHPCHHWKLKFCRKPRKSEWVVGGRPHTRRRSPTHAKSAANLFGSRTLARGTWGFILVRNLTSATRVENSSPLPRAIVVTSRSVREVEQFRSGHCCNFSSSIILLRRCFRPWIFIILMGSFIYIYVFENHQISTPLRLNSANPIAS